MQQFCSLMGMDIDLDTVQNCGVLHDIGKVNIPKDILNSPKRLTEEEFLLVQSHVTVGRDMLLSQGYCSTSPEVIIAYLHHEKWDGTGYPCGLKAEEIPDIVRISTLCDVFDALMEERSYKAALSLDDASEIIARARGTHFDPVLVDIFLANQNIFAHARLNGPVASCSLSPERVNEKRLSITAGLLSGARSYG